MGRCILWVSIVFPYSFTDGFGTTGTGTARATSIAKSVNSEKVPIVLISAASMSGLTFRLHELCWHEKPEAVAPALTDDTPKRSAELACVLLDCLEGQLGEELDKADVEQDRMRLGNDIEAILAKAAKEWGKSVKRGLK
jgi:hypothetical protein